MRRANRVLMDYDFDGRHNRTQTFGNGNSEDQYLIGDWDGNGQDEVAVRRNGRVFMHYTAGGGYILTWNWIGGQDFD